MNIILKYILPIGIYFGVGSLLKEFTFLPKEMILPLFIVYYLYLDNTDTRYLHVIASGLSAIAFSSALLDIGYFLDIDYTIDWLILPLAILTSWAYVLRFLKKESKWTLLEIIKVLGVIGYCAANYYWITFFPGAKYEWIDLSVISSECLGLIFLFTRFSQTFTMKVRNIATGVMIMTCIFLWIFSQIQLEYAVKERRKAIQIYSDCDSKISDLEADLLLCKAESDSLKGQPIKF